MDTTPTEHSSLWLESAGAPQFAPLDGDLGVDVAIVGAGITGVTAAWLLKQAGQTVALLEGARVGAGVTGHTSAHLTALLDTRYQDLISRFGLDGARLAAASSMAAIEHIAALVRTQHIDCEFERVSGYLFTEDQGQAGQLQDEAAAARQAGLRAEWTEQVPLLIPVRGAVRLADQAQFHPLRYINSLARQIPGGGSQIFEQTRVVEIDDGEPCQVRTERGTVSARHVIVATHVPINDVVLSIKTAPYRSYVLGARLAAPAPEGLFWDTAEPYHYLRRARDAGGELLLVGGADHKTGQSGDEPGHYQDLEDWLRQRFAVHEIPYRWSAQVYEPLDGLPYIGAYPFKTNVYAATGYAGNGLTFGTVAALLLTDTILGRPNPWRELYATSRIKPLASAGRLISEGVNVAAHFIGDRLHSDVESPAQIPPGEGALLRLGGQQVAAYRDEAGALHTLSPVCRHARCIVDWNTAEKTWDCPCHGGRYSATGQVFEGPPTSDLEPVVI